MAKREKLVPGQPIKFRYAGQTESGANLNKAVSEVMDVIEYISGFLYADPQGFVKTYSKPSKQERDFLGSAVHHWVMNNSRQFGDWYIKSAPKVKTFLKRDLELDVKPYKKGGSEFYLEGDHSIGKLPASLSLPVSLRDKLAEDAKAIDGDKGDADFTYAIYAPQGACEVAETFKLIGDFSTWAKFGSRVLSDPMRSYETAPVSRQKFLGELLKEGLSYEPRITQGGLQGAIEARKQNLMKEVYLKLAKDFSPQNALKVMNSDNRFPSPGTGVYVLLPGKIISNQGIEPFALKVEPRLYTEDKIAEIVGVLTTKERDMGSLHFQALEVPQKALKYISDPRKLEVRLS